MMGEASRYTLPIAVFGTLWGLLEMTLGLALKGLRIPFTGFLMVMLVTVIFLVGRRFAPRPGSVLMMGGVAALLKIFSIGGFILGPFWAILMEALIADVVLSTLGFNRVSAVLTAILLLAYTTVHPLLAQTVLYGGEIIPIYLEMIGKGAALMGLERGSLLTVAGAWLALITVLGTTSGLVGFRLGGHVELRVERLRTERRAA
jgi:hypothetical protein